MRDEPRGVDGRMTVAALLARWPELARVFHRRGMSCPGCAMSRFDALDYVASAYGLARASWLSQLAREAHPPAKRPGRRRRQARPQEEGKT